MGSAYILFDSFMFMRYAFFHLCRFSLYPASMDPLTRLKKRQGQRRAEPAPRHGAAAAHHEDDAFMLSFESAYARLQAMSCADAGPQSGSASSTTMPGSPPSIATQIQSARSIASAPPMQSNSTVSRAAAATSNGALSRSRHSPVAQKMAGSTGGSERFPGGVTQGWRKGPVDTHGQ
jgi:hypothetical protein